MTTPGARDLHGLKQDLSVAYISLNIKAASQAEGTRAEQLLRQASQLIIRGPAGSGKTTLLNYVAWSCAQKGEKANEWTGGVPFFVPLRSVARLDDGAPSVDRFVEYSVDKKTWALDTPAGWINDVLRNQKRAIVMIDGVDELPSTRRPKFWEWLSDFVEEYPNVRVVVTSRVLPGTVKRDPSSSNDQWNPPKSFVETNLLEMSDTDIKRFIEHWHNAVDRTKLEIFEIADLERARDDLPKKISDPGNRRIRELCSTPLLCAMVCVLHWREEGYLPRQRVDVYDKCCDMLIEARDVKRDIPLPPGPLAALTKNDKERVLQHLAFQMMHARPDGDEIQGTTYRIEITRAKAIQWIAPVISSFSRPEGRECTPDELLDHLIERTGLLREPAGNLVDFPHRTFQEYLAACAAGALGHEDYLANRADDDQWHETIMLAAGTPTGGVPFGHALVEALLKRAERNKSQRTKSQRIRKTCFALALGCLENLRQPDPQLRDRVLARVNEVVPPNNDSDAKILAVAADAAVPHLNYEKWKDEKTEVVAACAQALRLIGTERALSQLKAGYQDDGREPVVAEVCRISADFKTLRILDARVKESGELPFYATVTDINQILNLTGLKHLSLIAPLPRNLLKLSQLESLEFLIAAEAYLDDLEPIVWPDSLRNFSLMECKGDNYSWLQRCKNLETLTVVPAQGPTQWLGSLKIKRLTLSADDISGIKKANALKELALVFTKDKDPDLSAVSECSGVEHLRIQGGGAVNLNHIAKLSNLRDLELYNTTCESLQPLETLKNLRSLKLFSLDKLTKLNGIQSLPLQQLTAGSTKIQNFDAVRELPELKTFTAVYCPATNLPSLASTKIENLSLVNIPLRSLKSVSDLPTLRKLRLEDCTKIDSLEPISNNHAIESLFLESAHRLTSLEGLASLKSLQRLFLISMHSIEKLDALANLINLQELHLVRCSHISDLSPLRDLVHLKKIALLDCHHVVDISALNNLTLEQLTISPADAARFQIGEKNAGNC